MGVAGRFEDTHSAIVVVSAEGRVGARPRATGIGVRGEERHPRPVGLHVTQEVAHLTGRALGGDRAANEDVGQRGGGTGDGRVVHLEVVVHRAGPEPLVIRFVPDFPVPLGHVVRAVEIHGMLDHGLNEIAVRGEVARRVPVIAIPRESPGHEAELHARAHPRGDVARQHRVEVVPVVVPRPLIDVHVIVEDAVAAHALHAEFPFGNLEVRLQIRSQ